MAEAASAVRIPIVARGTLHRLSVAIDAALTGADTAISVKLNGATIAGFGGILPQAGSAADQVQSFVPASQSAAHVDLGDVVDVVSDGGATNGSAVAAWCTLVVRETSA